MSIWKKVLNSRFRFSLLETVNSAIDCEYAGNGSLDVIIRMQNGSSDTQLKEQDMYVIISDSLNQHQTHTIHVNEEGVGYLHIEGIDAVEQVVVLSDGNGNQEVNDDHYYIRYYIDEDEQQEDYARMVYGSNEQVNHHRVEIQISPIESAVLEIFKIKRNAFNEVIPYDPSEQFIIHVEGDGFSKTVTLDDHNDFTAVLEDIAPGLYEVFEEEAIGYETFYRMNHGEESSHGEIRITSGMHNEVQVINREYPHNILTIEKFIRTHDGDMRKPLEGSFTFRLTANNFDRVFELNENNYYGIDLQDIEPGIYALDEINDCDLYEVSYIINGQNECSNAQVEVGECDSNSIMIINTPIDCGCEQEICNPCGHERGLRICKFMKNERGNLCKPAPCDSFKVMLQGCGTAEIFNLNAANNWCVDIDVICAGEYEVRELDNCDYETEYIINNDEPSTCAFLRISGCSRDQVTIVNTERCKGKVTICKWIKDECGELCAPSDDMCFYATLKSHFFKESFALTKENNWCVCFENLREGSYEVKEQYLDDFDTSYMVNGCKMRKKARLIVENSKPADVKIINEACMEEHGSLTICKYLRTQGGEFVKPCGSARYEVLIEGENDRRNCVLDERNGWCVTLRDLSEERYQIREVGVQNQASYIVNGCEMNTACIEMGAYDQEVDVINEEAMIGELSICTWIRDCEGQLVKPQVNETFQILVEGRMGTREGMLCAENNWCGYFEDLPQGKYRVYQKDDYGYQVSYLIDGEEKHYARVGLYEEDVQVNIINSMRECQGHVTICKRVRDHGMLGKPDASNEYEITLKGRRYEQCFTLNKRNDFCVCIDDLETGRYQVIEQNETAYEIMIDGACSRDGKFQLGRDNVEIIVVNEGSHPACVEISKYMMDECGKLCKPISGDMFEILVEGKRYREYFTLCEENGWSVSLNHLKEGNYHILERDCGYEVSFLVNGTPNETGDFCVSQEDIAITIINEVYAAPCVEITKWIRDEDNCLVTPKRDEVFEVMVQGEGYAQRFELSERNHFTVTLDHLRLGAYEIKEAYDPNYEVCFQIDGTEMYQGKFIVDEHDVDIKVINRDIELGSIELSACIKDECGIKQPSCDDVFKVQLKQGGEQETYALNAKNNWMECIDGLVSGTYEVNGAMKGYQVSYEVNGHPVKNGIVNVSGNKTCVRIIYEKACMFGSLKIIKKVDKGDGCLLKPQSDQRYTLTLVSKDTKEKIVLNQRNNWTWSCDELAVGDYMLMEEGEHVVSFLVNGKEQSSGDICIGDGVQDVIVVNHEAIPTGILSIHASLKNCDGDIVKPSIHDTFDVMIKGDDFRKQITLSKRNNWMIDLAGLKAGSYRIEQKNHPDYAMICYRVDDGKEMNKAIVNLDGEDHSVEIINVANCANGSIDICKYMKDEGCGCLNRPMNHEEFEVMVSGKNYQHRFILNEENRWCAKADKLEDGMYEVKELNAQGDVTYIVNGERERDRAMVRVSGERSLVKVINHKVECEQGSITLFKFILNGDELHVPTQGSYSILIKNGNQSQTILLDESNKYSKTIKNLDDGLYQIRELHAKNDVTYIVDGNGESEHASLKIHRGSNHDVQIINHEETSDKGRLTLCKYLRAQDGVLRKPSGDQRFRATVSGDNFMRTLTMNKENNWCADLEGMPQGTYSIEELGAGNVSYIVNGEAESDQASVTINGDHSMVQIINESRPSSDGSIQLNKFIRNDAGMLVKPSGDDTFSIHVSRPGFNKLITLNQNNDWSSELSDLRSGNYVVSEVGGDDATYIINGGSEVDRAIVAVNGNANTVQIINSMMTPPQGSIHLCKFIRNQNNELVKPQSDETYRIRVNGPSFNQIYVLDDDNDFCWQIDGLTKGSYVISEVDQNLATFIINGGSEVDRGVVQVNNDDNDVKIINPMTAPTGGSITMCKFIRDENNDLIKPNGTMKYRVRLSGPSFNQIYVLDRDNDWCMDIRELNRGSYVVNELDENDVSYIVNGGSEVNLGVVSVNDNANTVQIINAEVTPSGGSINICKYLRDVNGQLVKPSGDNVYQVHVSAAGYNQVFALDQSNDWCVTLTGLRAGYYVLDEVDNPNRVAYIINEGSEVDRASIYVDNNENTIVMINYTNETTSSILLRKYIQQADGTLSVPSQDEAFDIAVMSQDYYEIFTLNYDNNFRVHVEDLMNGTYVVSEQNSGAYTVSYRVNGSDVSTGEIDLNNDTGSVDIINKLENHGSSLEILKFMADENGNLVKPKYNQSFKVALMNNGTQNVYDLNAANNWYVYLSNLTQGEYEVVEQGSGYRAQYMINGETAQDSGSLTISAGSQNIVEIINHDDAPQRGNLNMEVKIRDNDGELIKPNPGQRFTVFIEGNDVSESFVLDERNSFMMNIADLPYDNYALAQQPSYGYDVSYIVNGGSEQKQASVDINSDDANQVVIVNTPTASFYEANDDNEVKIVIE